MSNKDLDELKAAIASTQALINHLRQSLKEPGSSFPSNETVPNALALSSSAATLIRAQTTKLSLLVVNKPFTPTAISRIIKTLSAECIPALASAVQIAASPNYPNCVYRAMTTQAETILLEFQKLLGEIPVDERGVEKQQGRDTFASTGVVWNACDALTASGDAGVEEIAAKKANDFHGLVKDALEELREWKDDGSDSDGEPGEDVASDTDGDAFDSKCTAEMRPIAELALRVLEHVRLLFPPLVKRRIRRFPKFSAKIAVEDFPSGPVVKKLDDLLDTLHGLSDTTDEVAGRLYEHRVDETKAELRKLMGLAQDAVAAMSQSWDGKDDELSAWFTSKWSPGLAKMAEETHIGSVDTPSVGNS